MTRLGEAASRAALALGVLLLALDHGGFGSATRGALGVLAWWAVLLLVVAGAWPREQAPREALLAGALLVAFCAFTGVSALWAESAERAFNEFARVGLYLAVFTIAVMATRRGGAGAWVDGIGAGIGAVAALALLARCLGFEQSEELSSLLPGTEARLSFPLGYWNGLGIFLAMGIPLLLRSAVESRSAWARGLAAGAMPALGAAIYLTSSRGAVAVAIAGALTFVALGGRPLPAIAAIVSGAAGAALAVLSLEGQAGLADGPVDSPGGEGVVAALLVLLCCAGTGLLHARLTGGPFSTVRVSRTWTRVAVGVALLALLAGGAAVDPAERVRAFKEPPNATPTSRPEFVREHLLSGGGSGRWQFWNAALDQFEQNPLAGAGAGGFQAWWLAHGGIAFYVQDAHSLYFETLGELGLIGFALLAVAFGVALVAATARLRESGQLRSAVAAAAGGFVAFLVGAALDWIWELTLITIVGILCMGLLCGPATISRAAPAGRPRLRAPARIALVAVSIALIAAEAIPWATAQTLDGSRDALTRGDAVEAEEQAAAARALQPWAASPRLQLALIHEFEGDFAGARRAVDEALDREPSNWQLWTVAARIDAASGRIDAAAARLRRARELYPYSPLFARPDAATERALERVLRAGQ